jgi:hypothetical protein
MPDSIPNRPLLDKLEVRRRVRVAVIGIRDGESEGPRGARGRSATRSALGFVIPVGLRPRS